MYTKIYPDEKALADYKTLVAESFDPDGLLRSSGEAVANYDTAWKTVCVHKESPEVINRAVADFLFIGSAHIDALAMNGLRRPAMATMLSMLVSADMAGADTIALGQRYIDLHGRYLLSCIELRTSVANDDFSRPHADEILRMESILYAGAYKAFVEEYNPAPADVAKLLPLAEAATRYAQNHPGTETSVKADPTAPSEALIDMFSRLHALGMQD